MSMSAGWIRLRVVVLGTRGAGLSWAAARNTLSDFTRGAQEDKLTQFIMFLANSAGRIGLNKGFSSD